MRREDERISLMSEPRANVKRVRRISFSLYLSVSLFFFFLPFDPLVVQDQTESWIYSEHSLKVRAICNLLTPDLALSEISSGQA